MDFRLYLLTFAFLSCEATVDYKFKLTRSTDWQAPGGLVQYTLSIVIPESSPVKAKIKLPFNNTAILRLTKARVAEVSNHLSYTGNSTNLKSSADDGIHDIALFDFGEVTRTPSDNDTAINIEFEVQVMNHQHIVNGESQWVSIGTEYKNQSVWAAQVAVKTVHPASARPDLAVTFKAESDYHTVLSSSQISLRVKVKHSPLTTAVVEEGVVEWPKLSFLEYESITVDSGSVGVQVIDTPNAVQFKFGRLEFAQEVNFVFKVDLDPQRAKADGKIHDCTTYVDVKYNGSAGSCSSPSGSREFSRQVSNHFKFYVPQSSCDQPLGMDASTITDGQITASSYSSDGQPHLARLQGSKAWIPSYPLSMAKTQFLQVNFTARVKVRRISTRGRGSGYSDPSPNFVTRLSLYYSDDGVLWKPYMEGSKIKEFVANSDNTFAQLIVLPIPIEAAYIRINPTGWKNNISLRVEFYGCLLSQQPAASDSLKFTSRHALLDKANDKMYVCSVSMDSSSKNAKCYYSTNQGNTWTGMDSRLLTLLGYDSIDNVLYGVGLNGKAIMKSSTYDSRRFSAVSKDDWDKAASKATTTTATMLESHVAITDDPTSFTPQAEHVINSDSGTKWGVSAKGVHVEESSAWVLKALWMCSG